MQFKSITVGQFQAMYKIHGLEMDTEDKAAQLVMAMTGKTIDEVYNMPLPAFNKYCRQAESALGLLGVELYNSKPAKYIMAGGSMYGLNYEIKRPPFNAGKYVEVATFSNDLIGNLHLILASMAVPYKWMRPIRSDDHEAIANDMKQADFKHAYHAAVFFYAVFSKSMKAIQPFLMEGMMEKMPEKEAKQTLQDLQKLLDGSIMPKWYQNLRLSV